MVLASMSTQAVNKIPMRESSKIVETFCRARPGTGGGASMTMDGSSTDIEPKKKHKYLPNRMVFLST